MQRSRSRKVMDVRETRFNPPIHEKKIPLRENWPLCFVVWVDFPLRTDQENKILVGMGTKSTDGY